MSTNVSGAGKPALASPHLVARPALITLEALVALNAVYGGISLMINGMGMPDEWLARTPFDSWLWPGVFLVLIIAIPMTVAALAETFRARWAYAASVVAGAAQIGWIVAQLIVLQRYFFLQPILLVAGAAVLALAWLAHRREPLIPSSR